MRQIPPDFRQALQQHVLDVFFDECAYVHQAGYLSWIAQAKRPATRRKKILQSIIRLSAQRAELTQKSKVTDAA